MGQISDNKGNIVTRQGDTFYIPLHLTEEETEKKGTLFMQVINSKRKQMFPEETTRNVIPGETDFDLEVSASNSDLLTVPQNADSEEYKFAIKHCTSTGKEDTWVLGGMEFDELPTITVYPKVVNGGIGYDYPDKVYWTATSSNITYIGYTFGTDTTKEAKKFHLTTPSIGEYSVVSISSGTLTITATDIPTQYTEASEPEPEPTPEPPTYTYWSATTGGEGEAVTFRGKTEDTDSTPDVFTLMTPEEYADDYTVVSVEDDTLTISTELDIPTEYTRETEPETSEEETTEETEETQGE